MACDFVDRRVYIDLAIFAVLGVIHAFAWLEVMNGKQERVKVNNDAISRAAQVGIMALGILIAATFAVLQLTHSTDSPLPAGVAVDVFFASLWFLAALAAGLYVIWRLAMYPEHHSDVVLDVGIGFGLQLLACLIGVARLVVSVWAVI